MRSVSLSFSVPLYKKQLMRFWPLWSLYSFFLLMLLPVYHFLQDRYDISREGLFDLFREHSLMAAATVAPALALCFGLLAAMAVWSYLFSHRATSLMHALPLSRESLFLTNYVAGLSFFVLPNLAVFLLALGAQAMRGVVCVEGLLTWLLCQTLLCLFFYSFATLLAFVTGHILMLPVLFGVLNALAVCLVLLLERCFYMFVYGYAAGSVALLEWIAKWMTPILAIYQTLKIEYLWESGMRVIEGISGLYAVFAYAAVGILMTLLSCLLYRRRKLETAGEAVSEGLFRPVFKYGVGLCAGLTFGYVFYILFYHVLPQGAGPLLGCLALWGIVGYFAAEMLLRKTLRVWRKSYKGCLAMVAVFALLVLAMEFDLSGYEKTIPALEQVKTVRNLTDQRAIDDPAYIKDIIALHQVMIAQKQDIERKSAGKDAHFSALMEEGGVVNGVYLERASWHYVALEYTLKNGKTLRREYRIPVTADLLAQADSPATRYQQVFNGPEQRESYFPSVLQEADLLKGEVLLYFPQGNAAAAQQYDGGGLWRGEYQSIGAVEAKKLYRAVLEDLEARRIGLSWLLQTEEALKTTYQNTIYFTFVGDYTLEELYGYDRNVYSPMPASREESYEVAIPVMTTATSTLKALEELGFRPEENFVTRFDMERADYYHRDGKDSTQTVTETVVDQEILQVQVDAQPLP